MTDRVELPTDLKLPLPGESVDDLRLTVRGVASTPAGADIRLRVYLNTAKPSGEPKDSPGYVGSINFGHDPEAEADFFLNAKPALTRLAKQTGYDPTKPLTVTLELLSVQSGRPIPANAQVTFKKVTIDRTDVERGVEGVKAP